MNDYETSVIGRMDLARDLIARAKWEIARASVGKKTHEEVNKTINDACEKLIKAEILLFGNAS